jgi:hypothetical protein
MDPLYDFSQVALRLERLKNMLIRLKWIYQTAFFPMSVSGSIDIRCYCGAATLIPGALDRGSKGLLR